MVRWILLALIFGACGEPVLRNAPRPNTAAAAGVAAGAAAAITLADPNAAAKHAESAKTPNEKKPVKAGPNVPSDVLDRLDANGSGSSAPAEEPKRAPAQPPPDTSGLRPLRK
jgi:hypothetical protein